jgi:hypothetical protein
MIRSFKAWRCDLWHYVEWPREDMANVFGQRFKTLQFNKRAAPFYPFPGLGKAWQALFYLELELELGRLMN